MVQRIKNTNNQKSHHFFLCSIILLAVCAVVVLGLLFLKPTFEKKDQGSDSSSTATDQTQKTDDKKSSDDSTKKEEESTPEIKPEAEKNNTQYEGEDPNKFNTITGLINASITGNGALNVRVIIDQILSDTGNCTITVKQNAGIINTVSAPVEAGPSSSLCIAEVGAGSGHITITATVSADGKSGTITGEADL